MKIALSWLCFWLGVIVSETIVRRTLGYWYEWPYRIYNWLMIRSFGLQGANPRGPWKATIANLTE